MADIPQVQVVGRSYEERVRASGHGMAVRLRPGGKGYGLPVFWSKGWHGCQFGCGVPLTDHGFGLVFRETRYPDGRVVSGWYCRAIQ